MLLHVLSQHGLLIEGTKAYVTFVFEFFVRLHMLRQMGHLEKLFITVIALERVYTMSLHMLR